MIHITGLIITSFLNILANHMLLTVRRSRKYCIIAFTLNTIIAFVVGSFAFDKISNQAVLENVLTMLGFSYLAYICLVFKESFSKKVFTMLSVWIFSYISFFIAVQFVIIFFGIVSTAEMMSLTLILRLVIQFVMISVVFIWQGAYYNRVINLVPDKIINFMSLYLLIAFALLKSTAFIQLHDFNSIYIVLLFIAFIIMGYLAVFMGISASSKVELQRYDEMTGIINRSNIMDYLARTIRVSDRNKLQFALLIFDLDDFKKINDEHGHMVGDKALKHVAQAILKVLRSTDAAGRFGGDEFLIIQQYLRDRSDVEALVSRIFEEIKLPFTVDGRLIQINLSIGVSIFPQNSTDMEILISQADKAMYEAKKTAGCSCVYYEDPDPLSMKSEILCSRI
ncbi:MAG: GGDEF domain-containing protein [Pseudomonadota bacterium]